MELAQSGVKGAELSLLLCTQVDEHADMALRLAGMDAGLFREIPETARISLIERKTRAFALASPGVRDASRPPFDRLVRTDLLLRADVGFGPSAGVLSEMQLHWDTITQANSVTFFRTTACTNREGKLPGSMGVALPGSGQEEQTSRREEGILSQDQWGLVDTMQLTQRLLERKQQHAIVLVQQRNKLQAEASLRGAGEDRVSAGQYQGQSCDDICESRGLVFMPSTSADLAGLAWSRFVKKSFNSVGVLKGVGGRDGFATPKTCNMLAVRARGLTAIAIASVKKKYNIGVGCDSELLCTCNPTSKIGARPSTKCLLNPRHSACRQAMAEKAIAI
jgi:hypothetical protein